MYKCEIIADSLSPQRDRLTTFIITFPRIVLAEFNTHRMFSRNSASSRAIPFKKMVKMVKENPFIPIAWQIDHRGMQGNDYFNLKDVIADEGYTVEQITVEEWLFARDSAVEHATYLNESGITKQLCNRLLEPFMWHTVIVTSGEEGLENFFKLRCPQYMFGDKSYKSKKDLLKVHIDTNMDYASKLDWLSINKSQADIHIQAIAELMWDAYNESVPNQLEAGEWHMPFVGNFDSKKILKLSGQEPTDFELICRKIATARCARVSYLNYEGNDDYEADIKLYNRLLKNGHASPFEHVAKAMTENEYKDYYQGHEETGQHGWCRNFRGFIQLREIENL